MPVPEPIPKLNDILVTIDQTILRWKSSIHSDTLYPCPICNYMKSKTKLDWREPNEVGVCSLCPVYFSGYFFICKSTALLNPVSTNIKIKEYNNIKDIAIKKLKVLKAYLSKEGTWDEYYKYAVNKKTLKGVIIHKVKEIARKKQKIIKRKPT